MIAKSSWRGKLLEILESRSTVELGTDHFVHYKLRDFPLTEAKCITTT